MEILDILNCLYLSKDCNLTQFFLCIIYKFNIVSYFISCFYFFYTVIALYIFHLFVFVTILSLVGLHQLLAAILFTNITNKLKYACWLVPLTRLSEQPRAQAFRHFEAPGDEVKF